MEKLNSFLRLASISGVEAAVRLHIKRGDNLNARDRDGLTPLMLAAARNKIGVVKLLLEAGANPELSDPNGQDALSKALKAGHADTAAILHDAIAHITTTDKKATGTTGASRLQNPETTSIEKTSLQQTVIQHSGKLPSLGKPDAVQGDISKSVQPPIFVLHKTTEPASPILIDTASEPNKTILELDNLPLDPDFESGWEAQIVPVPPESDDSIIESAFQALEKIGSHKTVDRYEDWTDVDLDLPERATPLKRYEDDEVISQFLLAALREGMVTEQSLAKASSGADG